MNTENLLAEDYYDTPAYVPGTWDRVVYLLCKVLRNVHTGGRVHFSSARVAWAPFSAYNEVEARAELAAYHMDRCAEATRAFNSAFSNWHAAIILERHSEPERWAEVESAHAHLKTCLADLHVDFPDRDDAARDRDETP